MSGFTPGELSRLAALADHLVPAAEGMPCASAAGMPGPLLDQVLNARPDLRAPLKRLLDRAEGEAPAFIAGLYGNDREGLRVLGLVVAGGYYLSPDVRARLGYSGPSRQQPAPAPELADHPALQRVRARGPIWRDPDARERKT